MERRGVKEEREEGCEGRREEVERERGVKDVRKA